MVVISGDSVEKAQADEYGAARIFVDGLCARLGIRREQLLIVPGNHDVDWTQSRSAYAVTRAREEPASSISRFQDPANAGYLEVVTDEAAYQLRFANYAAYRRASHRPRIRTGLRSAVRGYPGPR